MNEKIQSALQSIDLTQIILAAAGGLGGLALWGRKRYRAVAEWCKRRTARRKAVCELPERVADIAEALAAMSECDQKMLDMLSSHSQTLQDQNKVLGTIGAMVHGEMELDPTPRFICDNDGSNLNVNMAYARLVGCGRDELMGFGYQRFVASDINQTYMPAFAVASAQHLAFESAINIRKPDGSVIEANVRIVPHPEHTPPAHYWVGVVTAVRQRSV